MASILPNIKPSKSLQIQFKKPNQRYTINSLTSTLKKLIPNIKEIRITSKKAPREVTDKKLYADQVLNPLNMRKRQKTQVKSITKEISEKQDIEYHPDKLKRKVDLKRIVLVPRHDYKVVAATNKRKRCTPKKDSGSIKKSKPANSSPEAISNDISFEDMIPSSIIHKIKDLKNTSSDLKNKLTSAPDLRNSLMNTSDLKNSLMNTSDLKNSLMNSSDLKNSSMNTSNLKNSSINTSDLKNSSMNTSNLKNDPIISSDLKMMPRLAFKEGLMDEESLTDEDFMEILTCPSPVWWEDPPDENFIEEPIGRFLNQENLPQNQDCTKVPSKSVQPGGIAQNCLTIQADMLTVTSNSFGNKKLIEKRLKLENLLSSLKNNCVETDKTKKVDGKERKISSDGSELSIDDEDLVKSLQSIKIPIGNQNVGNRDNENEIVCEKVTVETKLNDVKDVNEVSVGKTEVNNSKNHKKSNNNEIEVNETINNDGISIKNTVKINDEPKSDTKSSAESAVALNSPNASKKASSPRKSNRNSPKKHQLTKYYSLKSKRPRIIKQNPRNKIVIEHHIKTNINSQKTPEKKSNNKPGNVSKIKKAYLDLLQQSKIEEKLVPNNNKTSDKEESTKTIELNTKANANITETDKNEKNNTDSAVDIKSEKLSNNNNHENNNVKNKNSKSINDVPLILPKLTRNPQNVAVDSPKSIKSVNSDSTDVNSEMDTISDTNVHFIDEYDGKKDELVTVYQIISKNDTYAK